MKSRSEDANAPFANKSVCPRELAVDKGLAEGAGASFDLADHSGEALKEIDGLCTNHSGEVDAASSMTNLEDSVELADDADDGLWGGG